MISHGNEKTSQKKKKKSHPICMPKAGHRMIRHSGSVTQVPLHTEDFQGFVQG